MASAPSKLYADDVSLVVVLLDTNPFFWSSSSFSFSQFLSHVLAFFNAILTLNQLNQVVVIATGYNSCDYIFDSSSDLNRSFENGRMPVLSSSLLQKLEEFLIKDEQLSKEEPEGRIKSSLFSGSLSMALCYIQRVFRSGALHPHPRILCLQGSPDGAEQYVAIMNAIFSAQRSEVPIDSCYIGAQNSAFLQQTIFATDLHSRSFIHLPKPVGVDFRASCFCHKNTIDMGYICSVCLTIFCKQHKKCSTCGSIFGQAQSEAALASDKKRLLKHKLNKEVKEVLSSPKFGKGAKCVIAGWRFCTSRHEFLCKTFKRV